VSGRAAACPLEKFQSQFRAPAPNRLWLSDFTYVSTWQGFAYVAFNIDAFALRIVGWRVSRNAWADFVLDALEHALHARQPLDKDGPILHSDRGSPTRIIRCMARASPSGIGDQAVALR
jgi:putative transposase